MTYIKLGSVHAFPRVAPDKAQALEVLGAWQERDPRDETHIGYATAQVLDEIANTIQACCNLAAALGVDDLTPHLARCEERNRKRGRYDKEQSCK